MGQDSEESEEAAESSEIVVDLTDVAGAGVSVTGPGHSLWRDEFLTESYVKSAVKSLHDEYGQPSQEFGVYFLDGSDTRSAVGRTVEIERFSTTFDNSTEFLRRLYEPLELSGNTELICVVEHASYSPAGVLRTVRHTSEGGSRTLDDLQASGVNGWGLSWTDILKRSDFAAAAPEEITDVPTIAVARAFQGADQLDGVSQALYAALMQRFLSSSANTFVCALDRIPYLLIQAASRGILNEFDDVGSISYYGSDDTTPLWANFREHEAYLRLFQEETHDRLIKLQGLSEKFFFGYPNGQPVWQSLDLQVVDLREYSGNRSLT